MSNPLPVCDPGIPEVFAPIAAQYAKNYVATRIRFQETTSHKGLARCDFCRTVIPSRTPFKVLQIHTKDEGMLVMFACEDLDACAFRVSISSTIV